MFEYFRVYRYSGRILRRPRIQNMLIWESLSFVSVDNELLLSNSKLKFKE